MPASMQQITASRSASARPLQVRELSGPAGDSKVLSGHARADACQSPPPHLRHGASPHHRPRGASGGAVEENSACECTALARAASGHTKPWQDSRWGHRPLARAASGSRPQSRSTPCTAPLARAASGITAATNARTMISRPRARSQYSTQACPTASRISSARPRGQWRSFTSLRLLETHLPRARDQGSARKTAHAARPMGQRTRRPHLPGRGTCPCGAAPRPQ